MILYFETYLKIVCENKMGGGGKLCGRVTVFSDIQNNLKAYFQERYFIIYVTLLAVLESKKKEATYVINTLLECADKSNITVNRHYM